MRTALLSALKHNDDGTLRALAPLAGRSVLGWQIDFALDLKCERVICLCEEAGPEVLALQREVEGEGGEFHLIRSSMQLVSLLRTDDQLVMVLDGLLTNALDPAFFDTTHERLKAQVFTIPSDSDAAPQSADDFERLDAQRRWAGLAVVNSSTVQKLADFPPDSEPMSMLLRLALQDGAVCTAMPEEMSESSRLILASSHDALKTREKRLLVVSNEAPIWAGPFEGLAQWAARAIVQSGAEIRVWAVLLGALVWALIAGVLLWFDFITAGLIFVAAASLDSRAGVAIADLRARLRRRAKRGRYLSFAGPAVDVVAVGALIAALGPQGSGLERIALPVFAIGLARVAARESGKIAKAFWSDRTLHLVGFATAAFTGFLAPALAVFGLGALGYKLLRDLKN